ncbi:MAG: hypothetical protein WKF77_05170 [Planctomycetaceae bacterium]
MSNLQDAVDSFVHWLEEDRFLMWEAVVSEEQGIPLTPKQKKALGGLLNFNDEDDEGILYIDEMPRPSEPWHVILNKIAPHLVISPYRTSDCHEDAQCEGWSQIMTALQEHAEGLILPPGAARLDDVVPAELRHNLWLQSCFNELDGLGQEDSLTLADPEQHGRIECFIEGLRECRESVAFFSLTLDSLLTRIILPEKDRPIFLKMMREKLGVDSGSKLIAENLWT